MFRPFAYALALFAFVSVSSLQAEQTEAKATSNRSSSSFKSFTGKVLGNNVRMRTSPDLDSHIVAELLKDDYIVVTAEKGEFYAVEPPSDMKAFIFRGFVIDEVHIYTLTGQQVLHPRPDNTAIDISGLQTGMYIVEVTVENTRVRQKLIVR